MSVLVAVDDDGMRAAVLDAAVRLGRAFDEELYVVHLTGQDSADGDTRDIRDAVRADLADRDVAFSVSLEHVEHRGSRAATAIAQQLADIASDVAVSHAVIGHRSKDVTSRLIHGNTAFAFAEQSPVPVTIVSESAGE